MKDIRPGEYWILHDKALALVNKMPYESESRYDAYVMRENGSYEHLLIPKSNFVQHINRKEALRVALKYAHNKLCEYMKFSQDEQYEQMNFF